MLASCNEQERSGFTAIKSALDEFIGSHASVARIDCGGNYYIVDGTSKSKQKHFFSPFTVLRAERFRSVLFSEIVYGQGQVLARESPKPPTDNKPICTATTISRVAIVNQVTVRHRSANKINWARC